MNKPARIAAMAAVLSGGALLAAPAYAVYTGINLTGTDPRQVTSLTVNFPDTGTVPAQPVTGSDRQKYGDFVIDTPAAPAVGEHGTATITDRQGHQQTVPVVVGENHMVMVESPGTPAEAQCSLPWGACGKVQGDYAHVSESGQSIDGNLYGFGAATALPLNWYDLHVEFNGGIHNLSNKFALIHDWNIGVAPFWQMDPWRAGVTTGYQRASQGGMSLNSQYYGGFADWFAMPCLTVSAKGGGFSASHSISGDYFGAALNGYPMKDLSVIAAIDHYDYSVGGGPTNNSAYENDYTVGGEWLVSRQVPVSVKASYTYTTFSQFGTTHLQVWALSIAWYCNGGGFLVDRQRHGTLDWSSLFAATALKF